jgi:aldose 1-epimerase
MRSSFGRLTDGRDVEVITLGTAAGLQAEILTLGGILRRLTLPTPAGRRNVVLSLPNAASYESDRDFLGQLIGRFANRKGGAAFRLDGTEYRLSANNGKNHLHGGELGFGRCLWRVLELGPLSEPRLLLGLHSPAGDQGYPGSLDVAAEFTVRERDLQLRLTASSDAATVVSLTYHPYFNLSGEPVRPVGEMSLRIAAQCYLPVGDEQLIPTGEIHPVAGTSFDFRNQRAVQSPPAAEHEQLGHGHGYDHCWVLDPVRDCDAELSSPHSGIIMQVRSSLPGLQFYGGQGLIRSHPGLSGVCLEPQLLPNSPNQPGFPTPVLRPGERYEARICYRFPDMPGAKSVIGQRT